MNSGRFPAKVWILAFSIFLFIPRFVYAQQTATPSPANLVTLSDELEAITAQTMRCVVKISSGTYVYDDPYDKDNAESSDKPANAFSVDGSGVLVSADGYIVTNAHVVTGAHRLRVALYTSGKEEEEKRAKIVGIDEATDLAVLRIQGNNLPFLNLEEATPAKQGEISLAFGEPFGMERTVTMGIVSAINRQMKPDDPRLWIQTDAAVNPGNSGGPLIDARGHLLGINTVIYSDTGDYEGIALAIPAATVREVFHDLVEHGRVQHVSLGLSPLAINPGIAKALHLNVQSGILVQDVSQPGPAEVAGIRPGDVVMDIDGHHATSIVGFANLIEALSENLSVTMNIWRNGQTKIFHVTPEMAEPDPLPLTARIVPGRNLIRRLEIFGVTLDSNLERSIGPTRYDHGVVVAARSSTLRVGDSSLQPNDIIYQANGENVNSVRDLRRRLREIPPGGALVLQIERDHTLYYLPFGRARQ